VAEPVRLCFVCLGNICRSPTAEAVMARVVAEAGLADRIEVDSAGTAGWHVGDPPDRRSIDAAARRGIRLDHRGRQFQRSDFDRYDHVLAMDDENERALRELAPDDAAAAKVSLLRHFDPACSATDVHGFDHAVPDPYGGGSEGFVLVLDLVDAACRGLLDHLRAERGW
jgi:protein-tyrosine phosphatase